MLESFVKDHPVGADGKSHTEQHVHILVEMGMMHWWRYGVDRSDWGKAKECFKKAADLLQDPNSLAKGLVLYTGKKYEQSHSIVLRHALEGNHPARLEGPPVRRHRSPQ